MFVFVLYVCMCVCMYVCMYVFIDILDHTYIIIRLGVTFAVVTAYIPRCM